MNTEHRIDELLDVWADEQRLDTDTAAGILRAIVDEPRDTLSPSWWSTLNAQVTSAVLMATSPPGAPQMAAA